LAAEVEIRHIADFIVRLDLDAAFRKAPLHAGDVRLEAESAFAELCGSASSSHGKVA
jgi:hypothetical protein